jgi:hypothetical protein
MLNLWLRTPAPQPVHLRQPYASAEGSKHD